MTESPSEYVANVSADLKTVLRDEDALVSALTGGAADETVSHRVAVDARKREWWACVFCKFLDVAVEKGHCDKMFTDAPTPPIAYARAAFWFVLILVVLPAALLWWVL